MKKKSEKQKDLERLQQELGKNKNIFLTGYEKLTVGQDFELRKAVRGVGGSYQVIKNRIAERASEGVREGAPGVHFQGRHGRGPRGRCDRHQPVGHVAVEGRDFWEAPVSDQRAGAEAGDGGQWRGAQPGGGGRPGSEGKQVCG